MSLLVMEGVGLGFAGHALFSDLNLRIGEEDRIGVVGRNGSGKSSLFRLVARVMEPTDGTVRTARGLRIGYLPQEIGVESGRSLLSSVIDSIPGKSDLENMLTSVEDALATATEHDEQMELAQKLADLHEDLGHFDATYSKHEALSILSGLGFKDADMDRDIGEFSGGWRMRAVLAGLLFQKPDLLLLDEPTNHLDVPSVIWLGTFLKRYRGAFLLICHDREFLNEQISRVVAFESETVRQYSGNYEAYRKARAEELEILERRASNVAREREAAERFIRRFRAQATKARAVQSRIKALDRMDEIVLPQTESTLSFRFPPCKRSGQDVLLLEGLGHSYGSHVVFSGVDLTVRRGEHIAIVGANGNGKTTLLKILAGALQPSTGSIRIGHNVQVGYYAQHVTELLDTRSSIFDEVWRHSAVEDISRVRGALGTMLFSGDDVDKRIAVLSGGEKARVALARLMVNPGNVLLMDEPTNHLDLESSEALAQALETYDGTLLFVSHNRSFVGRLAKRVWNVEDGRVEEFPGTFAEYVDHCARVARGDASPRPAAPAVATPIASQTKPVARPERSDDGGSKSKKRGADTRSRRANPKSIQKKAAELEERIAQLETAQAERSNELSLPQTYENQKRYAELLSAYQEDAAKLEELMKRWEYAQQEMSAIGADDDLT